MIILSCREVSKSSIQTDVQDAVRSQRTFDLVFAANRMKPWRQLDDGDESISEVPDSLEEVSQDTTQYKFCYMFQELRTQTEDGFDGQERSTGYACHI